MDKIDPEINQLAKKVERKVYIMLKNHNNMMVRNLNLNIKHNYFMFGSCYSV